MDVRLGSVARDPSCCCPRAPRTRPPTRSIPRSSPPPGSSRPSCIGCGWRRRRCRGSTSTHWSGVFVGGSPFDASTRRATSRRCSAGSRRRCAGCSTRWSSGTCRSSAPATGSARSACTRAGSSTAPTPSRSARCPSRSPRPGVRTRCWPGCRATFDAFVGHKEACRVLPADAVLLASSPTCPVQMFRVRENLYATQFHPELDVAGHHHAHRACTRTTATSAARSWTRWSRPARGGSGDRDSAGPGQLRRPLLVGDREAALPARPAV